MAQRQRRAIHGLDSAIKNLSLLARDDPAYGSIYADMAETVKEVRSRLA